VQQINRTGQRNPRPKRAIGGVRHEVLLQGLTIDHPRILTASGMDILLIRFAWFESIATPFNTDWLASGIKHHLGNPDPRVVGRCHNPREEVQSAIRGAGCRWVQHTHSLIGIGWIATHHNT
jgi:hypothetical protein